MEGMYHEFFSTNQPILDKMHPLSLLFLFQTWTHLIKDTSKPKSTESVKEFIPESLDHNQQKNLNLLAKNCKEWGYNPYPDI